MNVARLRFPFDSAQAREFVGAVDRINRLAEESPGFIWRYRTGDAHPSAEEQTGDPLMVINMSVWQSYEHLHAYVYRSAHGHYVRRRYEWFDKIATPATALWWIPVGHRPTPAEGLARLRQLRAYGPTPQVSPCDPVSTHPVSGRPPGRLAADRIAPGSGAQPSADRLRPLHPSTMPDGVTQPVVGGPAPGSPGGLRCPGNLCGAPG